MNKRIAVDLAKSVYQVAESVRAGQVSQRTTGVKQHYSPLAGRVHIRLLGGTCKAHQEPTHRTKTQ